VSVYIVTVAGPSARLAPKLESAGHALVELCRQLGMRPAAVVA
jgi:hypothetical protein